MRYLVNGILLVILLFFVLDTTGLDFAGQDVHALSATSLPANVQPIDATELTKAVRVDDDKPTLLLLYTSWCPYCKKQITTLNELVEKHPDQRVVAVSLDTKPEQFAAFLKERPELRFDSHIYVGPSSIKTVLASFGAQYSGGIPYHAIFQQGRITHQHVGFADYGKLKRSLGLNR